MLTTLKNIKTGQKAVVSSLAGHGAIKRRLADMGITPGTVISVTKVAPLGDPIEIKLRGYNLMIRREDAKKIYVSQIAMNQ